MRFTCSSIARDLRGVVSRRMAVGSWLVMGRPLVPRPVLARSVAVALVAITTLSMTVPAQAVSLDDPRVQAFAERVAAKHSLDLQSVNDLLDKGRKDQRVIEAYKRPAESKPWFEYRKIFITDKRIEGGAKFWMENAALLERAEATYGVPASVIVAIIGVETFFGRYKGKIRVLDALMTLAFHDPKREKFFKRELEEFLLLAREGSVEPLQVHGSYAGAMGIPQFISSSYRAYSVDFDGDGRRDLGGSVADAIGSVGAYLGKHGWQRGARITGRARLTKPGAADIAQKGYKPHTTVGALRKAGASGVEGVADNAKAALVGLELEQGKEYWIGLKNFYVITRYNHSPLYAMAVYQLSRAIEERRR
jgi:membrane-bound lytic murein transglycosylase B